MTEFGEKFTLNVSIKTFFRIPISLCDENYVLLNDGTKSVVKLSNRKLLHSWTLTYPHSLTCPAIVDKTDESIYCIMDNKVLLKWSLEDDDLKLKTAKKAKPNVSSVLMGFFMFGRKLTTTIKNQYIHHILLPLHKQPPILLFSSGKVLKCEDLESNSIPIGEGFIGKGEDIIWADTITIKSAVRVVCVGFSKKNKSHTLYNFTVLNDSVSGYHAQPLLNGTEKLTDFCLNRQASSFYTVWSSGTVLDHRLESQTHSNLLSIPDTKNEPVLSIDCIDSNHIVLFRSNPDLKETYLEMWDIKFSAVKAKKQLKLWPPSSPQMFVLGSSVFLSQDEELMEIAFHVEKSTLANAVGKSIATTPKTQEFNWSKGKLTKLLDHETTENMDTSEIEIIPTDPAERNAHRLLEEGTDFLNYIPEYDLVELLRLALSCKFKETGKITEIDPDVILSAIFSTSFTDAFLVQFMKKLSLEQSMVALEVLLSFLNHKVYNANTCNKNPSDFQLFNWIFLVYQAHMEALLLSKDKKCMRLTRKLDSCISEKVKEYEEYDVIQNLCLVIQKKTNILPEHYMVGKYCIESLDT